MRSLWTFEEFDRDDAERAAHLRRSPPWPELVRETCCALRDALENGNARFGFDESGRDFRDLRAVVQFPLGRGLFDWLFNGQSGYRAQFRLGREKGLIQNARIISALNAELSLSAPREIIACRLTCEFEYKETIACTIDQVIASLNPELSKVWICEKLISQIGRIQNLFVSRTGPKLTFVDCEPWSSFYPEVAPGWLDIKGAFIGPAGAYQLKPPEARAANLECRGSA